MKDFISINAATVIRVDKIILYRAGSGSAGYFDMNRTGNPIGLDPGAVGGSSGFIIQEKMRRRDT